MTVLRHLRRHFAVSAADIDRDLPGDDLVPRARVVLDRGLRFDVPPESLWPWLAQLGKGRAGWYLPSALERVTPTSRRGARSIIPAYQHLAVGDEVPDWGPGAPIFRVAQITPPHTLVYLSLRDKADRWRWPFDGDAQRTGVLALSWALIITPTSRGGSQVHSRLRINQLGRRFPELSAAMGALMDLATIALLQRGLAERV